MSAQDPVPAVGAASLQQQAVRGSLWSLIATGGSLPLSLVSVVVAGRYLGPSEFGQYSLYTFYVTVGLLLVDLGLASSQTWAATVGRASDPGLLARTLRGCLSWNLIKTPIVVVAALWLLADAAAAGAVLAVGLAVHLLSQPLAIAVTADRQYGSLARIALVNTLVGSTGLAAASISTGSAAWALAAFWLGRVAALPMLLAAVPSEVRRDCVSPGSLRMTTKDLAFSGSNYLASLLSTWAAGRSELVFLERAGGGTPQGKFALSTTVAMRATLLADALYGALGIAMLAVRSADESRFVEAFQRALRLTTLLAMLTAAGGTAATALLAPPLFGNQYGSVVVATALLLQAALLRTAWQPLLTWIYTERVNRALLLPGAVAVVVDVGLSVALIPAHPFEGAVTANIASTLAFLVSSALTAQLPRVAAKELLLCTSRFLLVAAVALSTLALPAPLELGTWLDLCMRAVTCTGLAVLGSAVVLRALPPLFNESEMSSITGSLPSVLRRAFIVAARLLNGAGPARG